MLCPYCGQSNDDANQECAVCRRLLPARAGVLRPAPPGRVNKTFYLGSVAGGGLAGVVLVLFASLRLERDPSDISTFPLLLLGEMVLMYAAAVFAVLLYKSWRAIQDGHARTTPGKAVGFLLIPFYNFYWAFVAYWGFAKDHNRFIERHGIDSRPVPEGLFLASCIMTVAAIPLAFVPGVKYLTSFASWTFWLLIASSMCDAVNRIAAPADPGC